MLSLKYIKVKDPAAKPENRYSFVVSAKTAKQAVARNLLKRRGRDIIIRNKSRLATPFHFVVCNDKPVSATI